METKKKKIAFYISVLVVFTTALIIMGYKLIVLHYPLNALIPAQGYNVELLMQANGHNSRMDIRTYLPKSDSRQNIYDELISASDFISEITIEGENRIGKWYAMQAQGQKEIHYSAFIQAEHIQYELDRNIELSTNLPKYLHPYLQKETGVQVGHKLIRAKIKALHLENEKRLFTILETIHTHLQNDFENRNFSGYTDALTALKLEEASCNGKSRLFVALTRTLGIPSRLVGGLIMQNGTKKTSHQWVEVFVQGHWIPFDTINNHFMALPANYLTLYYGDKVLFGHTVNINFTYQFSMSKRMIPKQDAREALEDSSLHAFNMYTVFERIGISQNLLKIILMIPFGALVVVIFRNVIGLETFGTFLPALIATASRETGLLWGLIGFFLIIILTSLVRHFLDWLGLLHSPKMAIMLTVVVIVMLLLTLYAVELGAFELAHVSLFPIAILAITSERFAIITQEEGIGRALKISFTSAIVIVAAYLVMASLFLQSVVLAFPEVLLIIILANLWLGKWVGLRLSEYVRFRKVIFAGKQA